MATSISRVDSVPWSSSSSTRVNSVPIGSPPGPGDEVQNAAPTRPSPTSLRLDPTRGRDGDASEGQDSHDEYGSVQEPERVHRHRSDQSLLGSAAVSRPSSPMLDLPSNNITDDYCHERRRGSFFLQRMAPTSAVRAWNAANKLEAVPLTSDEIRATTKPRRIIIAICCVMYLISVVFLIVAQTGSTKATKTSMSIYFFRMDLSNIFNNQTTDAGGTTNPALASTISESIGLHDYYQAGLWGYCEGFYASGLTACSRPRAFYWFNPVGILLDEMLLRSTLDLPPRVETVLNIVRLTSQVMFGLYLLGIALAFVLMLVSPLVLLSRWWSLPMSVLAGVTVLPLLVASAIATALALAYRTVASAITQLNIVVTMGPAMFVMVWVATGMSVAAFLVHAILGCCSTSVRDIKTGQRPHVHREPEDGATTASSQRTADSEKKDTTATIGSGRSFSAVLKKKAPFLSPLTMHPVKRTRGQRNSLFPVLQQPVLDPV